MNKLLLLVLWSFSAIGTAEPLAALCPEGRAVYNEQTQKLTIPAVRVDNALYQVQLDLLTTSQGYQFQVSDVVQRSALTLLANAVYDRESLLLVIDRLCLQKSTTIAMDFQVEMHYIPDSSPMRFLLKQMHRGTGEPFFDWSITDNKGALSLLDRAAFDRLAVSTDVAGITGVKEVKFIIRDIDTDHPVLFFINSQQTPLHYDFFRQVLGLYQRWDYNQGNTIFTAQTYFRESRQHLAGSIIAYDNFKDKTTDLGVYTLEFWPTDPVQQPFIEQAYQAVSASMSWLPSPLAYHPVGNTHLANLVGFVNDFIAKKIRVIDTEQLFQGISSAVLNQGEAYGKLKIIQQGDRSPSNDVIAIYSFIPNSLAHVGGIITSEPQTPLSHINLKARQNNTPNAYVKHILTDEAINQLIGKWVKYTVNAEGVNLVAVTEAEALQWLADKIPSVETIPVGDLSRNQPIPLTALSHADWVSVGVKAANVAELGHILAQGIAPEGYALPFGLYDEFMSLPRCVNELTQLCTDAQAISFYQLLQQQLNDTGFNQSASVREQFLTQFRELIETAEVPQALADKIETVRLFWEPKGEPFQQKLRVRSSTNNEDLEGFNGAGLYDSFTHKSKEGLLVNSIKQVWASLWNLRAFEVRRLHRINHLKTYMGVLIHPNYGDEQANGVAISKNIYNPSWQGIYVNAQYGELSITNPEPIETDMGLVYLIPDEFIMTRLPASVSDYALETIFIRYSNVKTVYDAPITTTRVLLDTEMTQLNETLQQIHTHFKALYQGDDHFAMDIEFKITETQDESRGQLAIKQARPWID